MDGDTYHRRILEHTASFSIGSTHDTQPHRTTEHPRVVEWTFRHGEQRPLAEPVPSRDIAQSLFETQASQSLASGTGPGRLTLGPRKSHSETEGEPRAFTNADNHFRLAQNLLQGMPMSGAIPRQMDAQPLHSVAHNLREGRPMDPARQFHPRTLDSVDQLATAIIMQQPMPLQRQTWNASFGSGAHLEHSNVLQEHGRKFSHLQSQKQQMTPTFNLNPSALSPSAYQESRSSTPFFGQGSSPTARVAIRRNQHHAVTPSRLYKANDHQDLHNSSQSSPFHTPQRLAPAQNQQCQLQTLALSHAPPIANGIQLVSPYDLPDRFRHVFPYQLFNAVQSKCFQPIYQSNDNIVVSAPTGSGKTVLLELAICRLAENHKSGQFKIVYQAPTKSLCSERLRDWQKKFSHLNLPCAELTGDTSQGEMARVRNASIIVTTPEKWDSITRKWADHHKLVQMVKLFLIDEVHMLKDTRGATLEAVVSRMKTVGANVRFVALSATVPNSGDIAMWLGKDHSNKHLPAHRETFGESFRPVQLQKFVHGFDGSFNDFAFEKHLDGKLPKLIHQYTQQKPIMVFCWTRKSCESTASLLAEWWNRSHSERSWPAPNQRLVVISRELQQLVTCGVAFHHAGLDPQDRHAIEDAFLKGIINVICCTGTLAVGVNLPCNMVVLKGTMGFQDGRQCEYSDLEVMQMLGRAGRPQFDDRATAVILTRTQNTERYNKMISGQDILESTLHLNLIEHLNSEVSLGFIKSLYEAKQWIGSTFLNVRIRQNPTYYKIDGITLTGDAEQRLEQVCEKDIKLLQEQGLMNEEERFGCTEYGHAMSRYMVQFNTMKILLGICKGAKMEEILQTICQALEFRDLRMKPAERPVLREFNKSPFIKFPIKESITTTAHKVSLIIQVQLGGIDLPTDKDFQTIKRQFMTDKSLVFERIARLVRCVIDCKVSGRDSVCVKNALDLARSLSAEFWENSNLQLRQIPQMGPVAVRKLVTNNVKSIEKLSKLDTATIERIMSRNPPYGKKTKDILTGFPRLQVVAEIVGKAPFRQGHNPKVHVKAVLAFQNDKIPIFNGIRPSITFMAETTDGILAHFWRGSITKLEKGCEIKFAVEISRVQEEIRCVIACDEIVGTTTQCILQHGIPSSVFPTPVTLKEIIPQPLRSEDRFEDHGNDDFDKFGSADLKEEEILAVANATERPESNYGSDEFPDLDDIEISIASKPAVRADPKPQNFMDLVESFPMSNGRWTCLHACRDGQLLKNGKICKHRCCKDGLDKRPKVRKRIAVNVDENADEMPAFDVAKVSVRKKTDKAKKSTSDLGNIDKKFAKKEKNTSTLTQYLVPAFHDSDFSDIEVVDLTEKVEAAEYGQCEQREYITLQSLRTSIQADGHPGLSNRISDFGAYSEAGFLRRSILNEEDFDLHTEQEKQVNTTPAAQPQAIDNTLDQANFFDEGMSTYKKQSPESPIRNSQESLEAAMLGLEDPLLLAASDPITKVCSSPRAFVREASNFSAFKDQDTSPEISKNLAATAVSDDSTIATKVNLKRAHSEDLDIAEVIKARRITRTEQIADSFQDAPCQTPAGPSWLAAFDSELIDGFKDYVEFVD